MTDLNDLKPGWRQWWITGVSSLGQMIGSIVATIVGVIIPMLQILSHPELPSWYQGLLAATDLIGIAIGSTVLGSLSDKYGYLGLFRVCPAAIMTLSIIAIIFPNLYVLTVCLFFIGFAIGGEYSLDSDYISELMPESRKSFMVGVGKSASALGNIVGAGLAWWILIETDRAEAWPRLLWIVAGTAAVMLLLRIHFAGSPTWLLAHGRKDEARKAMNIFYGPDVDIPTDASSSAGDNTPANKMSMWQFVKTNFDRLMLSGVPWACEGLGVYGIGIFIPTLVIALGLEHFTPDMTAIRHVASSVHVTFLISCIMLPGFIVGLWLIRKGFKTCRLLYLGFFLSAASLTLLGLAYHFKWPTWLSIILFMAFEVFLQSGPHLVTYVLPPKIYPVAVRSLGSGLSASLGKVGAVIAVFFIPVILHSGGILMVLAVSVAVMIAGGLVTAIYGKKILPEEV